MGRPERLRPSPIQERLVEDEPLGRKTGEGFYRYDDGSTGRADDGPPGRGLRPPSRHGDPDPDPRRDRWRGAPPPTKPGRRARWSTSSPSQTVAGRLRGKTGTLNNPPFNEDPPAVKALAGYLPVDGGGAVEYVMILNGPTISDQSEYRPLWDQLVDVLVTYPSAAGPDQLGPR